MTLLLAHTLGWNLKKFLLWSESKIIARFLVFLHTSLYKKETKERDTIMCVSAYRVVQPSTNLITWHAEYTVRANCRVDKRALDAYRLHCSLCVFFFDALTACRLFIIIFHPICYHAIAVMPVEFVMFPVYPRSLSNKILWLTFNNNKKQLAKFKCKKTLWLHWSTGVV